MAESPAPNDPTENTGDWFSQNAPSTSNSAILTPAPATTQGGPVFTPVPTSQQTPQTPGTYPEGQAPQNPASPDPVGSVPYTGNPQQYVQALIAKLGLKGAQADPAALTTIVNALKGRGVNAALDSRSDGLHKGIMLNGQFVKLLDGSDNWIWQPGGDTSTATASGTFDPATMGQLLEPYGVAAPNAYQAPEFKMPTGEEALAQDPGYGFRLGQGRQALEQGAAARGVLNTGGTLKDVLNYGQAAASQEYQNAFDRALATYTTNTGTGRANYNTLYDQWLNDAAAFRQRQVDTYTYLSGVPKV